MLCLLLYLYLCYVYELSIRYIKSIKVGERDYVAIERNGKEKAEGKVNNEESCSFQASGFIIPGAGAKPKVNVYDNFP